MSQRELEQRVRNILTKQSDNGEAIGGCNGSACCTSCNGSGLVITADQRYGAALVGGAFSWKGILDMIGELAQIVGELFSNIPSKDTPSESACRRRLRQEGITDKKSFNQWARRNHPDKVSSSDKRKATALFQDIRNCLNSEGLGGGMVGGVRKGEKLSKEGKDKLMEGLGVYLNFMRQQKAQGLTHKEALVEWKMYKKSAPKKSAMSKTSIPTITVPEKKTRISVCSKEQCERLYGSMGMPVQGLNANEPSLMEDIEVEIIDTLNERTEPDWSGQEQLREALNYEPEDVEDAPDFMYEGPVYRTGLEDIDLDNLGFGRGMVGGVRKGEKLSPEHKAKLMTGLQKYQMFMKQMKSEGLTHKEALQIYKEMKAKQGGNWFDSFKKGFMLPFEAVAKLAPLAPLLL